jgi:hypothetical protein
MKMPCRIADGEIVMAKGNTYNPASTGRAVFVAWKYTGLFEVDYYFKHLPSED